METRGIKNGCLANINMIKKVDLVTFYIKKNEISFNRNHILRSQLRSQKISEIIGVQLIFEARYR